MKKVYAVMALLISSVVLLAGCVQNQQTSEIPTLTVAYLPTDHHAALFVACDNPDLFKNNYGIYLKAVKDKEEYELYKGDKKVANVKVVKVTEGGASIMNLMTQGQVDVALVGNPPVIFYIDKGTNAKIIMNLHTEGSAVVVRNDIPVNNWEEFVNWIKEQHANGNQVKIGHPLPTSIQYVMIKDALKAEGITYTEDPNDKDAMVLLMNCKGQKTMPQMLAQKQLDAVIAWEPTPEIIKSEGIGKVIAYSEDLPSTAGGKWTNHPCCCLAASEDALTNKRDATITFAKLLKDATDEINKDKDLAVKASVRWLGTDEAVERESIEHIKFDYRLEPTIPQVIKFVEAMKLQGLMSGKLKDVSSEDAKNLIFDLKTYNDIVE
ncbi:ABC-type nitrate/sulfonate/bicarbonate transport system, periplasmic component [Methanocaldococcus bathoardescens]|uniref:ABC-type nitrate/sulfonate/bicarbonate transport system, periplasmic component n=1 Tax=Methanocaldococcus bathoardescens TaxID=1301915 RepID=A0A076LGF1_9EURY|nr:ABC transporter substrate-binding protein [Methanocaldococcus bathoardescens]AIJ05513.1 ABC-type nitrate/sulfonate/bicarbonate transport system, periplasmic component [Methanocaldococcus bathoardescens]